MAAATQSYEDEEAGSGMISDINVTPLVDITLVLLIIFMVTAKLVVSQAMPTDLPKAASADTVQAVLTIGVDAEGHVLANAEPIADDAALFRVLQRERTKHPDLRAVISASERASHGRVMHVLDVLRTHGVSKVAFAAEKLP